MAPAQDRRGREIRIGDWGGGTVLRPVDGEFHVEEIQGRVVGLDRDENGWWVVLRAGKRAGKRRIPASQVRCVAPRPLPGRRPPPKDA